MTCSPELSSGLFYGDPLYRPSAAALFFAAHSEEGSALQENRSGHYHDPIVTTVAQPITAANLETYRYLFMNVLHGTANLGTVKWELATCTGDPGAPVAAGACPAWTVKLTGTGSRREQSIDWVQQLLDDPGVNQSVTIRLRVWNDGEPEQALYDFVYLDYVVNPN